MPAERLQGSHFANDEQAKALNDLVTAGKVDPCLSETFTFEQIPHVHQLMYENRHPHGNMACLVNAPRPRLIAGGAWATRHRTMRSMAALAELAFESTRTLNQEEFEMSVAPRRR